MADYFHIATGQLVASSSSKRCPAPDWLRVTREDYIRISAIRREYRTVVGDSVVEATGSRRGTVDAQLLANAKNTKKAELLEAAKDKVAVEDAAYVAAAIAIDNATTIQGVEAVQLQTSRGRE